MPVKTTFATQSHAGGNIVIAALSGRFAGKEAEEFIKEVDTYIETAHTSRLIIDLDALEYIGSQGASALMALSTRYQVKITNVSPLIQNVFDILQLNQLFEIYLTKDEALKKF